jgi:hypothetical protein
MDINIYATNCLKINIELKNLTYLSKYGKIFEVVGIGYVVDLDQ